MMSGIPPFYSYVIVLKTTFAAFIEVVIRDILSIYTLFPMSFACVLSIFIVMFIWSFHIFCSLLFFYLIFFDQRSSEPLIAAITLWAPTYKAVDCSSKKYDSS
jgi:hypothetical protein